MFRERRGLLRASACHLEPNRTLSTEAKCSDGATGPNWTVKRLQGKMLQARNLEWVIGTNTPGELEAVKKVMNSRSD